jgi:ornithine cyclodeaminase
MGARSAVDVVACDRLAQCRVGGEVQHLAPAGIDRDVVELCALTSGRSAVDRAPHHVTVCDLTGAGAQDIAIAVDALARVRAHGLGTRIG